MRPLYSLEDEGRVAGLEKAGGSETFRTAWRRDYARLIHSASFRRLQGKTQVFPGHEGDFFRNRLTHSLEVAQIAKSIAIRLNHENEFFKEPGRNIQPDLVEFAGMAHDLGHPPFGHNGEEALDQCMKNHGGFEGNAQTLRILTRLEKKATLTTAGDYSPFGQDGADDRAGLDLSYRSLASILKYDSIIPERANDRASGPHKVVKGYYKSDALIVEDIKRAVVGDDFEGKFKTVECTIMDIADDIAYSTYDLEDVFKSGFLRPLDLFALNPKIYEAVVNTINSRIKKQYPETDGSITQSDVHQILHYVFFEVFAFSTDDRRLLKDRDIEPEAKKMYFAVDAQQRSQLMAENGYHRTALTSSLIQMFLNGIEVIPNEKYPQLSNVRLEYETFIIVEVLKNITYEAVIRDPALQVVEFRGKDIIIKIFDAIKADGGDRLLPKDFREVYQQGDDVNRHRTICDFIAGMTDRYAVEFYSRLFGANGMTMHKPL
ncbi:dNTP triphosphohydrolase [Ensifer adhaerens]|uniref:dGTP triphosphohydrolase n=1 Tax=Ensifer adhaerens TaxID=106592 RepID=UPI0023A92C66|nr:dNTP triphosphohydrolase [Ensifer adhaerens]WDZ75429.1 dNTP triphosphohydrolase [Ensifer adhaerens]